MDLPSDAKAPAPVALDKLPAGGNLRCDVQSGNGF